MSLTRRLTVVADNQQDLFLKVAFATSDNRQVDQHFGSASAFALYGVNPERAQLLQIIAFSAQEREEDRLADKLAALDDCIAVYCRACGASAVRQLQARHIQPVKVNDGAEIRDLLAALQQELREGPSSWLAKAIQRQRLMVSGFDAMEADGWQE